jgi:Protein of unknown function (DUF2637)
VSLEQLRRVRHGARAALTLGVTVSIVANILHANDNVISQAIAAWAPLALLITIELIARVPVRRGWLSFARLVATATIAGIAAWVSYWHMVGVALKYGEEPGAAHLIPLTVDGLVVVAWVCLVELGGRIREAEQPPPVVVEQPPAPAPSAAEPVDSVSTAPPPVRKPQPTSKERVERAHKRTPQATNDELAARLNLSTKTVQRYRPPKEQPEQVNGRVPELAEVPS